MQTRKTRFPGPIWTHPIKISMAETRGFQFQTLTMIVSSILPTHTHPPTHTHTNLIAKVFFGAGPQPFRVLSKFSMWMCGLTKMQILIPKAGNGARKSPFLLCSQLMTLDGSQGRESKQETGIRRQEEKPKSRASYSDLGKQTECSFGVRRVNS